MSMLQQESSHRKSSLVNRGQTTQDRPDANSPEKSGTTFAPTESKAASIAEHASAVPEIASKKSLTKNARSKLPASDIDHYETQTCTFNPMSNASIPFILGVSDFKECEVPPLSLKSDISFTDLYRSLPTAFPSLDDVTFPYVRDEGIKTCIQKLGQMLNCTDYRANLLQFWFLDVVTDCLWIAQDEYCFSQKQQRVHIEWLLYIFDLIRAGDKNFTRRSLFKVFQAMVAAAEQHVESACENLPAPQDLLRPAHAASSVNPAASSVNRAVSSVNRAVSSVNRAASSVNRAASSAKPAASSVKPAASSVNRAASSANPAVSSVNAAASSVNPAASSVNPTASSANPSGDHAAPASPSFGEFSASSSASEASSLSEGEESEGDGSYVALRIADETEYYKLPRQTCRWYECLSSSMESLSEHSVSAEEEDNNQETTETGAQTSKDEESIEESVSKLTLHDSQEDFYYRPDMHTPPRFRSTPDLPEWVEDEKKTQPSITNVSDKEDYMWVNVEQEIIEPEPIDFKIEPTPVKSSKSVKKKHSSMARLSQSSSKATRKASERSTSRIRKGTWTASTVEVADKPPTDDDVMKALVDYNLWKKRASDMADPRRGWLPHIPEELTRLPTGQGDDNTHMINETLRLQWMDYLTQNSTFIDEVEENIFINTCALLAIKQCVFQNFYDSFQFKLVKLAFRTSHTLVTQRINDQWFIPKVVKGEFKRPVAKKVKPKKDKKSKQKKGKSSKGSKKSKSKKSSKSSKKSKSTKKSKSSKSTKGSKKKDKPKKLTKEEKEALAKKAREEQLEEERLLRLYENRKFMFPLGDATDEAFFSGIFDNWVKPSTKKDKKGKKDKKKGKKKH